MEKKKVLHVVKVMDRAGAETMIMNIFRNIDRTKIEFDFLYLSDKVGDYEEEIINLGGKIYKLPEPEKQGRIKNFFEIYKIIKKNGPYSAIHSHIMFYNGFINLIAYLTKVRTRISHSHSSNDIKKESVIRRIYIFFSRCLIKIFSNVKIACGQEAGIYLYGKKQKFIILKNGIDLDKYKKVTKEDVEVLKRKLEIKKDELVIGHVGRFEKVKNQEYFIELAKAAKKLKINFKIVLVGNGSMMNEIVDMIEKSDLKENFCLPGVRTEIPDFMKVFDVFIMPSLYEGFPLTVVEALAGDNICYLSNNVPQETKIISSRVKFFDLSDDKEMIIQNILYDLKNKTEINLEEELTKQGFSIKNTTNKISEIYFKKV